MAVVGQQTAERCAALPAQPVPLKRKRRDGPAPVRMRVASEHSAPPCAIEVQRGYAEVRSGAAYGRKRLPDIVLPREALAVRHEDHTLACTIAHQRAPVPGRSGLGDTGPGSSIPGPCVTQRATPPQPGTVLLRRKRHVLHWLLPPSGRWGLRRPMLVFDTYVDRILGLGVRLVIGEPKADAERAGLAATRCQTQCACGEPQTCPPLRKNVACAQTRPSVCSHSAAR